MRFRTHSYVIYPVLLCVAMISALFLNGGCSGGGGSLPTSSASSTPTSPPTVAPPATPQPPVLTTVTAAINWGTRTRATTTPTNGPITGLSSALSATITLTSPGATTPAVSWDADRPDKPAPGSLGGVVSYQSPSQILSGTYLMTVTFYPEKGSAGLPVGVAQASVTVLTTGALSYTISTTGTLAKVVLTGISVNGALVPTEIVNGVAVPKLPLGENGDLVYSLLDSAGDLLAQSVTGTATGTASNVALSDSTKAHIVLGDQLIGDNPGTITVAITVDGITSAASPVIIRSTAQVVPASSAITVSRGTSVPVSVTVPGAPSGTGVTWQIIPSPGNPDTTGGAGTFTANPDNLSGTYTAPVTANPLLVYTYILRATSTYDPDATADITITVDSEVTVSIKDPVSNVSDATLANPDTVYVNSVINFAATVSKVPAGSTGVTWTIRTVDSSNNPLPTQYGAFTSTGMYTAPSSAPPSGTLFVVRAVSKFDPNKYEDYYFKVVSAVSVDVTDPKTGVKDATAASPDTVYIHEVVTFASTVTIANIASPTASNTKVTWSLTAVQIDPTTKVQTPIPLQLSFGSLDATTGTYTAPSTEIQAPANVVLIATATSSYDPTKSYSYYFKIKSLVAVSITNPDTKVTNATAANYDTVFVRQSFQFVSTVTGMNEPFGSTGVTWTFTQVNSSGTTLTYDPTIYGTLSPDGTYTAPNSPTPTGVYLIATATSMYDVTRSQQFFFVVVSNVHVDVTNPISDSTFPPSSVTDAPLSAPDIVSTNRPVQFSALVTIPVEPGAPATPTTVTWSYRTVYAAGTPMAGATVPGVTYGMLTTTGPTAGTYVAPSTPEPITQVIVVRATSDYDPSQYRDYYFTVQNGSLTVGIH